MAALMDFMLNLVGLLIWWNWLALHLDPLAKTSTVSLVGTLRKADAASPRSWKPLFALLALLFLRALFYWQMSGSLHWTPKLQLGLIDLSFHLDPSTRGYFLARALLYSVLSFTLTLGIYYLWVLLLSVVNAGVPDTDPLQKQVRLYSRWLEGWPTFAKLLVPFVLGALLWLVLHPALGWVAIVPKAKSAVQIFEQAVAIGAATYLAWKYLIIGILLLHLLNSYVYFGKHSFWNFINTTACNLLHPVRWIPLRIGKVDFLPVIGIALVFLLTELVTNPPEKPAWYRVWFYHALPF